MFLAKFSLIFFLLLVTSYHSCAALNNSTSDDPNYTYMLQINKFKFYYSLVATDDGDAISVMAVYQDLAWLGVGTSPDGEMIGGVAVIGQPDAPVSSTNPGKYTMSDESVQGVVLMDTSAQTLKYGNITQDTITKTTTMSFTQMLDETGEQSIKPSGKNFFIYAMGGGNSFPTYHSGGRGSFQLDLSGLSPTVINPSQESPSDNEATIWAAHGIIAIIAWAFLMPFGVASTFLRSLFSSDKWFKAHLWFNATAYVLTVVTFILAVVETPREEMFSDPHFVVGWVMVGTASLQVIFGVFRPNVILMDDPLRPVDVVANTIQSMKSGSIRAFWEVAHKFFGFALMGTSLWQMQSGLTLLAENFGYQSYLYVYWLWIIWFGAAIVLLKLWSFHVWASKRPVPTKVSIMSQRQDSDTKLSIMSQRQDSDTKLVETSMSISEEDRDVLRMSAR